jgi:preprotein translocase subunit SecA
MAPTTSLALTICDNMVQTPQLSQRAALCHCRRVDNILVDELTPLIISAGDSNYYMQFADMVRYLHDEGTMSSTKKSRLSP